MGWNYGDMYDAIGKTVPPEAPGRARDKDDREHPPPRRHAVLLSPGWLGSSGLRPRVTRFATGEPPSGPRRILAFPPGL